MRYLKYAVRALFVLILAAGVLSFCYAVREALWPVFLIGLWFASIATAVSLLNRAWDWAWRE